jgi:hypothetical protein
VSIAGSKITVPDRMRPFVRQVASVFDRYLQRSETRHSRAV